MYSLHQLPELEDTRKKMSKQTHYKKFEITN